MIDEEEKQRTTPQNASLHKYCADFAEVLNNAGYDQIVIMHMLKDGFKLPWTMYALKAFFQIISNAMYGKKHTKELTTLEMTKVYEVFDKKFSEMSGCRMDWPSEGSMRNQSLGRKR